nr:molybdopterin-guanine dinucleotide biosynthesis protein B [uncultured Achromobacter sp.]
MSPVFGIAGRSGSGKTTLIEAMLPLLAARGLRVNVIKHSHHDFQMEPPGKDSARFRLAGAQEVMVASPYRYAIVHELRDAPEPSLDEQLARLSPADLVLVEGFKQAAIARLELYRPALGKPALHAEDGSFLAVVTDAALDTALPCLPLNDPARVVQFICDHLGLP